MRRVARSPGLIILAVAANAAAAVTNLTADTNDQGWRSDRSSLWVGQTTARIGSHTAGIHSGLVLPFWVPDLGGLNVLDAELSVTIPDGTGLTYSTGAANADVYGIRSGTNSAASASDYTGGTLLVDNWFNISTNLCVGEKTASNTNLTDWISGQVGTTGGTYVFITIRPDVIDGTYRYANLNTANAANARPELRLTIGSMAVPSFALAVDAASAAVSPDGLSWTNAFKTIQSAVDAASFNATNRNMLLIKGGTYRENISINKSGAAGLPLILARNTTNDTVVISGRKTLTGWIPAGSGAIYSSTDMGTNPVTALYANNALLTQSREPNSGWWASTTSSWANVGGVTNVTITDTVNLQGMTNDLTGAIALTWYRAGNIFKYLPIKSFNPTLGSFVVEAGQTDMSQGYYYVLMNQKSLMDLPGEWAVQTGTVNTVFLKSPTGNSPSDIESPYLPNELVKVNNQSHIRFDGLVFTGAAYAWNSAQQTYVNWNAHNLYVNNAEDIGIYNCVVYGAPNTGICFIKVHDSEIANSIIRKNGKGILMSYCTNNIIRNNDIGWQEEDSVRIYYRNKGHQIHSNYIHHTAFWGHSDNMQIAGVNPTNEAAYVTDLDIRDNVFLGGGQSTMTQETMYNVWENNMYVGSEAVMLILGHGTSGYHDLVRNTFALSHYSSLSLTWTGYTVSSNVFCTGNASTLYTVPQNTIYLGDYNWFYPAPRETNQSLLAAYDPSAGKTVWFKTLAGFQAATGQDAHSVAGNPQFNNAPLGLASIDKLTLSTCTTNTLILEGTPKVSVGEIVEYNFDGIARTVTAMPNSRTIVVDPALSGTPDRERCVLIWGSSTNLTLDLRSPQTAGSTLYIPDYQAGDFDSDGMRDIPPMPSYLE